MEAENTQETHRQTGTVEAARPSPWDNPKKQRQTTSLMQSKDAAPLLEAMEPEKHLPG